ncbi:MAG: thrombospondin type 3 repeat-containing protein [Verrucomicrobiota bacterium]
MHILLGFVTTLLAVAASATAQSTLSASNNFAYGANAGWLDFRPSATDGVVVGGAFLSGHIYAANFGWIDLGDGTPGNGYAYSNTSAGDCGVNHDGTGTLSGYGYAANIGWIHFGWAGANDPNRAHFDLSSGQFLGYAYSANTGWINLGTGNLTTTTVAYTDADHDGIADAWEIQHFGNLTTAGIGSDQDGDGQSDAAEYAADTDPNNPADFLRIISQNYNALRTEVTLQFSTTRPTRSYTLQTCTSLAAGDWTPTGASFLADAGAATTKLITFASGSRRFFRIVAQPPLP